jgi:metal-responsive CopG/Arc/MetJ family transcriptional regulator
MAVVDVVGFIHTGGDAMGTAVKKTISLPPTLSKELNDIAREEGKTVSAVIQEALRLAKRERLKEGFRAVQGYWTRKAKEKGIITERDLRKYLAAR